MGEGFGRSTQSAFNSEIAKIKPANVLTVGASGCDYTSTADAIAAAVAAGASVSEPWAVLVYDGEYAVDSQPIPSGIHLIGMPGATIIPGESTYAFAPRSNTSIRGFTFDMSGLTTPGSCIYLADPGDGLLDDILIENNIMIGKNGSGTGIGDDFTNTITDLRILRNHFVNCGNPITITSAAHDVDVFQNTAKTTITGADIGCYGLIDQFPLLGGEAYRIRVTHNIVEMKSTRTLTTAIASFGYLSRLAGWGIQFCHNAITLRDHIVSVSAPGSANTDALLALASQDGGVETPNVLQCNSLIAGNVFDIKCTGHTNSPNASQIIAGIDATAMTARVMPPVVIGANSWTYACDRNGGQTVVKLSAAQTYAVAHGQVYSNPGAFAGIADGSTSLTEVDLVAVN